MPPKPVHWIGSSLDDLKAFPDDVQEVIGYALYLAQLGGKHPDAKPLDRGSGISRRRCLEVVENYDGDTFRAVYTVRFAGSVYVLHAFQKKSRRGIATPKSDIDRIKARLQTAREDYQRPSEQAGKSR